MRRKRPAIKQFSPSQRRQLFKESHLIHRQNELDIRYLKQEDSSALPGRILIITPRKVGSAPERNKLRRRLTALYYEEGWYKKKYDLLIYCRKGSADLSFDELKMILQTTFNALASR